jgi:hypothetical protein
MDLQKLCQVCNEDRFFLTVSHHNVRLIISRENPWNIIQLINYQRDQFSNNHRDRTQLQVAWIAPRL